MRTFYKYLLYTLGYSKKPMKLNQGGGVQYRAAISRPITQKDIERFERNFKDWSDVAQF